MKETPPQKLLVSLFSIPEDYRSSLEKISQSSKLSPGKVSINTCIVRALESYLNLPLDAQPKPCLPSVPLSSFTVRTTVTLKQKLNHCAASWQLKTSLPVSMNSVVNTAILIYLQNINSRQ